MHSARPSIVSRDKHQTMLDEMHSALSSLGDQVRTPYPSDGDKLLPAGVKPEKPGAQAARKHIEALHGAFKSTRASKGKK